MRERLRKGKAEQERRAHQAARRAEQIWSASSSQMRRAERAPREAVYKAEMLKWRIEGGGLRPRRPRSLELGGARRRRKPFQTKGLLYRPRHFHRSLYPPECVEGAFSEVRCPLAKYVPTPPHLASESSDYICKHPQAPEGGGVRACQPGAAQKTRMRQRWTGPRAG
jgi:hypothetical protein